MRVKVYPHKIEIKKEDSINEKEVNVTKVYFDFVNIPSTFTKEAYFTKDGTSYKVVIANDECDIPNEVLDAKGQIELGVVAYNIDNNLELTRYNPRPIKFLTILGSLKDHTENSEPITPSELEQYQKALNDGLEEVENVDIDINKVDDTTTISITNRQGVTKTAEVKDGKDGVDGAKGEKGDKGDIGETGPKGEKGDKGDTGPQGIQGEKGAKGDKGEPGQNGTNGTNGEDAKINGVNTLTIQEGENITINQSGSTMTISSTGGGSSDYTDLTNKPSINNVTLSGNKSLSDLGIQPSGNYLTSESDPIFSASASANITSADITNWNGKSPKLSILSYGNSTWNDFITAYNNNSIVYCRASSNSNPATGSQTRLGFMAYVNNATNPTEVEFQYYRSVSSHSANQQGDQVFVYKLTSASGGTWSVTTRETSSKIATSTGLTSSYSNGTLTLSSTIDISGKLDTSKVKSTSSTTSGDVYDVTYINSMIGDIESLLGGI